MLDLYPDQLLQHSNHMDQEARLLADRHYNRQTPGATQFAPNGPKIVLRDCGAFVLWVWINSPLTRWDGQTGYYNQTFRNESQVLSSLIILEAEQHAIGRWGPDRMYSYIDGTQVRSTNPGYCYMMAGWHKHGKSKSGKRLLVKYDECDS